VLQHALPGPVNDINAPIIAEEQGIAVAQTTGIGGLGSYPNLISCRVHWDGGSRVLSGVLFGGVKPRIVQVDNYQLDANPEGVILVMQNSDVPGVIGQVGTILAAYGVNIGEWRMGRETPGGEALSFINLDSTVPAPVIEALSRIPAVTTLKLVVL
jgi:D-3-phosphoglycerate dehydrogenase